MWLTCFIIFIWVTVALIPDPDKEWRSNWLRLSFKPDFVIGGKDDPYLLRWWIVPRNKWFNVYLHQILRDDNDRALHDHPWDNCSVILKGQYQEVTLSEDGLKAFGYCRRELNSDYVSSHGLPVDLWMRPIFSVVFRKAQNPHRLELFKGKPCWTLFISGPRKRDWGFHCEEGWVHWKDFTDPEDRGVSRHASKQNQESRM